MARPGISYESVHRFIEKYLTVENTMPSIAAIIGGCGGSATTITKYRQRFLAANQNRPGEAAYSSALEDAIQHSVSTLWHELVEGLSEQERHLETVFSAKHAEAEAEVEEARTKQREAEIRLDQIIRELDETRAALESSSKKVESLNLDLASAQTLAAESQARCDGYIEQIKQDNLSRADERRQSEARIEDLKSKSAEAELKFTQSMEKQHAESQSLNDQFKNEVDSLNSKIENLNNQLYIIRDERTEFKQKLALVEQAYEGAEQELKVTVSSNQELLDKNKSLEISLSTLSTEQKQTINIVKQLKGEKNTTQQSHAKELSNLKDVTFHQQSQIDKLTSQNSELLQLLTKGEK